MCGIIGYVGKKEALPILTQGLTQLEYRGYDSAGVVVAKKKGQLQCTRSVGKIKELESKLSQLDISGTLGIGHTRWATHGEVLEKNAHPHLDATNQMAIVHNGIIENYLELKQQYLPDVIHSSDTDSEVLVNLIAHFYEGSLVDATRRALQHVRGTYGLVLMHKEHEDEIIAARLGSPLVIGIGKDEYYIASDASPILPYTQKVIFLEDYQIAHIKDGQLSIRNLENQNLAKKIEEIDWTHEQAQKNGFEHFMLKEIHDQPDVFMDAIRGRIDFAKASGKLGGLNMTESEMRSINRVVFLACGTAAYASQVGAFLFENIAGIQAEVAIASEFRYKNPVINEGTLVFGVSQSGETADTLAALQEAKRRGAKIRGIVNVVGSTMARETDGGTYIHAGPELAVASTKAYTNMIAVMVLYALQFGRLKNLSVENAQRVIDELLVLPDKMRTILDSASRIQSIAKKHVHASDFLFLARGINVAAAYEASLKLKEISYIHSEATPAGEMKHGMNALLGEAMPVVGIMTRNNLFEKMRSNMQEVLARKSKIILIGNEDDDTLYDLTDDVIPVPKTEYVLEPILNTIPLQLFAYYAAVELDRDVDRPRNLAKSVTVE